MSLRIGIGGLWHETNTFVPGATTLDDFHAYVLAGDAADVGKTFAGTATEIGDALAACEGVGADPVPLAYAGAVTDHLRRVGIEPSSRRVLLVKSAVAWRAAFAEVAPAALAVDAGGPTTCRLATLPYRSVRRPIVPLDALG